MSESDYEWVPLKEFARQHGKSQRTIHRWIALGYVTAKRIGPRGHWLVKVIRAVPTQKAG